LEPRSFPAAKRRKGSICLKRKGRRKTRFQQRLRPDAADYVDQGPVGGEDRRVEELGG
jgi:hypothetical protein